jgi:2-amino-4-hydroxy-6-hydroxymethyldihydropteridine diphosphokinase
MAGLVILSSVVIGFLGGEIVKWILFSLSAIDKQQGDLCVLFFTLGFGAIGVIEAIRRCVIARRVIRNFETQGITIIALGSNLGNTRENILDAISRLEKISAGPLLKSSLWQTTPVNCPSGSPIFLNAVVALVPREGETPESLLEKLQTLEKEFGRQPKKVFNEARPLDLDLIAFGNEIRDTDFLKLPHPRAHERAFVLQPLNEIAPDLILPRQTKTASELLQALRSEEILVRVD